MHLIRELPHAVFAMLAEAENTEAEENDVAHCWSKCRQVCIIAPSEEALYMSLVANEYPLRTYVDNRHNLLVWMVIAWDRQAW